MFVKVLRALLQVVAQAGGSEANGAVGHDGGRGVGLREPLLVFDGWRDNRIAIGRGHG